MLRSILPLLCGLLLLIPATACRQETTLAHIQLGGQTMGTTWSLTMQPVAGGPDAPALEALLQDRLDQINRLMSTFDAESELSRFNNQTTSDWFAISEPTAQVIALALEISAQTGGAFDISVGPLVELWGFGATARGETIPSADQVKAALAGVGYKNIRLRRDPPALSKLVPQLQIDLSAIAKGYAVDALGELLHQQGVSHYLLEIGGEMKVSGLRGDGTPWRIAIEKPLEGAREVALVLPLTATALATSGNYRNFYQDNGERYAHTLDPVSGRPIRHKLASVTVLDETCARADALATAIMVMGEVKGRRFCEDNQVAAYFLIHEKTALEVWASPAFQRLVDGAKR